MRTLLISHEEAGRPGVIGDILESRGIETKRHVILGEDGELNLNFPDHLNLILLFHLGLSTVRMILR